VDGSRGHERPGERDDLVTGIVTSSSVESYRRQAVGALHDPHDARERMDPEFELLMHCLTCGKIGTSKRKHIHEATREHSLQCPERHNASSVVVRVLYPKQ
jgi:hypothetical protein